MRLFALLVLVLAVSGCDRPIVAPLPVDVETVGLDLRIVRTASSLPLALRAGDFDRVTRIEVFGQPALLDGPAGVFRDTLVLSEGLNAVPVAVYEGSVRVTADTLYAVFLPLVREGFSAGLPARIYAAASSLPDGRVLVSGGASAGAPALATMDVLSESGASVAVQSAPLTEGRVGHASVVLPDGQVLLLGGATKTVPASGAEFVPQSEVINPVDLSTRVVSITGGTLRRMGFSARVLQTEGRTIIYAFGGLQPAQIGVAPVGSVAVLEWFGGQQPRLEILSPVGGAGSFPSTSDHVQLDINPRAVNVATSIIIGERDAFAFEWRTPGGFYPFDLVGRTIELGDDAFRTAAAGVVLRQGVSLIVGGKSLGGQTIERVDVYADGARRIFELPGELGLQIPRFGHVATNLGGSRIVVLGGLSSSGTPVSGIEIFRL